MYPLKQSTSIADTFFAFDGNGDAVTGIIDGSWTKRISKNGGAFAAMTVTITEMENGWYAFTISTSHSDTLGILSLRFSAGGAKQVNLKYRVDVRVPDDHAFPTVTGRSMDVDASGGVEVGSFQVGAITAAAFTAGAIDAAAIANGAIDAATFAAAAIDAAAIATGAITAAKFAAGAIDAAAIATDAIGAAEFSQAAADKIWTSTTRTLSTGAIVAATFGVGAIDAAAIATDAIGAAEFSQAAADKVWSSTTRTLSTGAIVAGTFAVGAIDAAAIATDAIGAAEFSQAAADKVWGSTTRTLSAGAITNTTFATGAIDAAALAADAGAEIGTAVWASVTRTLTAFSFSVTVGTNSDKTGYSLAAGSITNTTFAAGAIDANVLAADAAAEIRDSVWAKAMTELASVPGVTGTVLNALEWCFLLARNKRTTTASTETLRNDADSASIATATVSDDSTTFTRQEWA